MDEQVKTGLGIAEIIGDKRDDVLRIAGENGAFNVRVFGSVARGEAREDSDVDFIAEFREKTSIFDLVGMWLDLKELLDREVSLVADNPNSGWIVDVAREEGVPL